MQLPAIPVPNFALPARLKPVKGLELACLFDNKTNSVYDNCLPIFYKSKSILMQKNITGKKVMVRGKIVLLDNRWGHLYISDRVPLVQEGSVTNYIGLFVNEIHVLGTPKSFFNDLWRLDHFQINDYDEDCLEFYLIESGANWPNVPNILNSYLAGLQLEGLAKKLVPWFAIVPKVNLLNSRNLKSGTDLLQDYYVQTYKRSVPGKTLIPINGIGHGICSPSMLKRNKCIFQYDQRQPILRQEYSHVC